MTFSDKYMRFESRKRVPRACDSCRVRKTKCDGDRPCLKCRQDNQLCTFNHRNKTQDRVYSSHYVDLMEAKLRILSSSLEVLVTGIIKREDLSKYVDGVESSLNAVIYRLQGGKSSPMVLPQSMATTTALHSPPCTPLLTAGWQTRNAASYDSDIQEAHDEHEPSSSEGFYLGSVDSAAHQPMYTRNVPDWPRQWAFSDLTQAPECRGHARGDSDMTYASTDAMEDWTSEDALIPSSGPPAEAPMGTDDYGGYFEFDLASSY